VTATVSASVTLQGINLSTFNVSSVASGVANAAGSAAGAVVATVTDFPMTSVLSLTTASRRSLLQLSSSAVQSACNSKLAAGNAQCTVSTSYAPPPPGRASSRGRRLLTVSTTYVLTFTGVGSSTAGAQTQFNQITDTTALSAMGTALGATAATSPPSISALMSISVAAGSSSAAAAISSALSNPDTLSSALASTGLSFGALVAEPVVLSTPPSPPSPPTPPQESPYSSYLQGSRVPKKHRLAVGLGVGLGGGAVFFTLLFAIARKVHRKNIVDAVSAPVDLEDTGAVPDEASLSEAPLSGGEVPKEEGEI